LPELAVRESVAIFPSGLPVLKKNASAAAGVAGSKPINTAGIASRARAMA
jgi:hypothetical protein